MKKKYISIEDLTTLSEEVQSEEFYHSLLKSGENTEFLRGVCWGISYLANQAFMDGRCEQVDLDEIGALRKRLEEIVNQDEGPESVKINLTEKAIQELKEKLSIQAPSHIMPLDIDDDKPEHIKTLEDKVTKLEKDYKDLDKKLSDLERRVAIIGTNKDCPYIGQPNTNPIFPPYSPCQPSITYCENGK